jgi:hypothetical protein
MENIRIMFRLETGTCSDSDSLMEKLATTHRRRAMSSLLLLLLLTVLYNFEFCATLVAQSTTSSCALRGQNCQFFVGLDANLGMEMAKLAPRARAEKGGHSKLQIARPTGRAKILDHLRVDLLGIVSSFVAFPSNYPSSLALTQCSFKNTRSVIRNMVFWFFFLAIRQP